MTNHEAIQQLLPGSLQNLSEDELAAILDAVRTVAGERGWGLDDVYHEGYQDFAGMETARKLIYGMIVEQ